jgi:hypothetical protein
LDSRKELIECGKCGQWKKIDDFPKDSSKIKEPSPFSRVLGTSHLAGLMVYQSIHAIP